MTTTEWEFSRRVPVREVPEGGRDYRFEATAAERAAVARRLGVIGIESLKARFTVTPEAGGVQARGVLDAVVVQQCVVTLEPVTGRVRAEIAQRFAADGAAQAAGPEIEFDALAEDPPEPLEGGAAELGELAVEHLSLALDPYPRRPEAEATLPHEEGEDAGGPFAKLRDLKFSATEG